MTSSRKRREAGNDVRAWVAALGPYVAALASITHTVLTLGHHC